MAVDSRSLVEPAVAQRRVNAHQQHISSAGVGKICDVETERIVAAAMPSDVKAIEDHHRLAVGGVELDHEPPARILLWNLKDAPVPADACGRVIAAERVETFALECGIVLEWQFDGPVMRQVARRPVAVVKCKGAGGKKVARLLEVARSAAAKSEVLRRIVCVAEMEAPAEVEE